MVAVVKYKRYSGGSSGGSSSGSSSDLNLSSQPLPPTAPISLGRNREKRKSSVTKAVRFYINIIVESTLNLYMQCF